MSIERWSIHDAYKATRGSAYEKMTQAHYIAKASRIAVNVYDWSFTEPSVKHKGRLIERYEWEDEVCYMWDSPDVGLTVTKGIIKAYDGNGQPMKVVPVWDQTKASNVLKTPELTVYHAGGDKGRPNLCVPIYGGACWDMCRRRDCLYMVTSISDTQETIRQQVWNQKAPLLAIAGNSTIRSKLSNMVRAIGDNMKILFIEEDLNGKVSPLNLNSPYNVESLEAEKKTIFNEILETLGVDSQEAYQKKERKIVDEQEANDELLNLILADGLKTRREACELMNELWDVGASVEVQDNIRPEAETKDMGGKTDDFQTSEI